MNEYFMSMAIQEAKIAENKGEVPVGAIIVRNNKIISRGHNIKEDTNDPTDHAEIIAIRSASKKLKSWRLNDCDMYVTLEPCPMCAGAIVQSRIKTLYIGTFDPKAGACGSVLNVVQNYNFNHWVNVKWLYDEQCSGIIKEFFKSRRRGGNTNGE